MIKYFMSGKGDYTDVAKADPSTDREKKFTELWQKKLYQEAMESFPDSWHWVLSEGDALIKADMPTAYSVGIVMSDRAYKVIAQEFPALTKLHHELFLDGERFHWIAPDFVPMEEGLDSPLDIVQISKTYKNLYSQRFVDVWKSHGFTSAEFVEATPENIDRIFI